MEIVIKNKRLRNFLYTLGFDYREVPDKTGKQEFIYLFQNTNDLSTSINFYREMKRKNFK